MVWEAVIDGVPFASSFGVTYVGFLLQVFPFIAHTENSCSLLPYEFHWLHLLHWPSVRCGSVVKPTQHPHHFSSDFVTLVAGITLWFYAQKSGDLEGVRGEHENMMPLYISFHSNTRIVLIKVWLGSNWFLRLRFFLEKCEVSYITRSCMYLISSFSFLWEKSSFYSFLLCHIGWLDLYLTGDWFLWMTKKNPSGKHHSRLHCFVLE